MDSYEVLSFIGEGSFGRVFKAKEKESDAIVALKVIRKKGRSSKDLKNLRQECDIQRELNHPNIIRMIDSFDTETELVVVTEYAEKELHSILAKEGCLNEQQVQQVTWDLVSALYYLHSHRVLHRDLKPQNVLLDSTGRAKLCDFGLARIMTNATHILTSIKGTPLYMAPELIDEKPYDHQADLWSLGCIVYELIAGQPPFCTMSIWQLVRMIRHKPVQWPSFISKEARSFLQGLLHKDPIKRMSWPEILQHPFVSGHILILPEDVQSESPFTKPLTHSQQEAKQAQKDKLSSNARAMKLESEPAKPENREHDLRHVKGVMQAMECVPMSDDDSVRATSAFSVRDSLKTDDEDQSHPITAANAKLLRHEYNVMNNSNLVVCNLENNMAQLMATNKKADVNVNKMDKIVEEKHVEKPVEESKSKSGKDTEEGKNKAKSIDTASHSLENPKNSTKCSSDVSSGLSKSVPPSYKQKFLQFSRDKLRFGSGGNKLTRSIKRSFTFNRSWDKNKTETQRRTSEPALEVASIIDNDKEKCSKEEKDEDIEKCEVIEEVSDDKEVANNDRALKPEEKMHDDVKEPSSIELEEWEAFLNSNITEVMDGDVESLTQLNMVSMVVGVVGSAARGGPGGRGGRVCGAVAALLALPALATSLPRHTLLNIQDVYLEAKVVYNFVAAVNTLMKNCKDNDDDMDDRLQGVTRMMEVCAWLCARCCRGVRQFATAVTAHNAHPVFTRLLRCEYTSVLLQPYNGLPLCVSSRPPSPRTTRTLCSRGCCAFATAVTAHNAHPVFTRLLRCEYTSVLLHPYNDLPLCVSSRPPSPRTTRTLCSRGCCAVSILLSCFTRTTTSSVRQFATAVTAHNAHPVFTRLLRCEYTSVLLHPYNGLPLCVSSRPPSPRTTRTLCSRGCCAVSILLSCFTCTNGLPLCVSSRPPSPRTTRTLCSRGCCAFATAVTAHNAHPVFTRLLRCEYTSVLLLPYKRPPSVRQFATAVTAHNAHPVFTRLLRYSKSPRIALNIVGLLITVLQDLPEHADVVEKILFDDEKFNFMSLLEQPSDALRMRLCILISLLCTFSCTAFSVAMETKWSKKESDSLEALHSHCNGTLNRAARLATKELSNMPFYSN
ncbi:protein kinase domain-containing protein [Phthorimaea operculella]|nr:protein kinase domain-containing protein [Phthorimaea operculella]